MRTAFDHELVDPKVQIDLIEKRKNKIFCLIACRVLYPLRL